VRHLNRWGIALCATAAIFGGAAPAAAQGDNLARQCAEQMGPLVSPAMREYCVRAAYALGITQPRVGMALIGGNPVQGTASTMGTRLGALPRLSLAARLSAAWLEIPDLRRLDASGTLSFPAPALNVDAAIGVFGGAAIAPTVGGFGSVDLLASAGVTPLPGGRGFEGQSGSWAVGARVGLLRESFTLPGVSLSGVYRRVGDIEYGSAEFSGRDAYFRMRDIRMLSARAAVSKRVLFLGLTGGVGWDRHTSDVLLQVRDPVLAGIGPTIELSDPRFRSERSTAFINASWTMLLLNFVGEAGLQAGGRGTPADEALRELVTRRGYYGSLTARLAF
jgi:hypothetical protein